MTVDPSHAEAMATMFEAARDSSPVRQVRYEMHARAREWRSAIDALEEMGEDWSIELVGSVVPWMRFAAPSADGRLEGQTVDRVLHRDGGVAIQFTDQMTGRPVYINRISAASPAVVKK